jgi:gamma-glutamyltranspeptidase/glutathione hydrolase
VNPTPTSRSWITLALCLAVAGCSSARTVASTRTAAPPASPSPLLAPQHSATYARFAIATDHPEASLAGAEVLAEGGTAADAAAAAMLALGVASPASSGLGGGGFALYYRASDHSVTFLDFRESAPAAMTAGLITPMVMGPPSTDGGAPPPSRALGVTVGVPGEPRGIEEMLRRFGTLGLARVVAPAARLAEEGFTPSEHLATLSQRFVGALRHDPLGQTWVPDGADGIRANVTLRNPALARTLRSFGASGAQIFYEGPLADEIVRTAGRIGGVLTADDLRRYRVTERAPLVGHRYGHRWVTAPPESAGGYTMLASLALLERWVPGGRPAPAEADLLHAMAESWRGPFLDRARYFGDPDFVRVPVDALLEPARVAARAALFDAARSRPSRDYDLPLPDRAAGPPASVPLGTGTSHICVVDAAGNIASVTTTINIPFGAGVSVAGFWLNDELDDFTPVPAPGSPAAAIPGSALNQGAPNRRPVSTMTPTIVFQGDDPVLVVGGSGGTRIVTSVEQAAWRAIVLGTPVGEAVAHPRIHQAAQPESLSAEAATPEAVVAELRARGHQTDALRFGAIVQAIRIVRGADGVRLEAASDPRKGGRPAGR